MKLDFVKSFIALAVSGLIAFGFYTFHSQENKDTISSGSFIFFATTLIFSLGISFKLPRTSSLIKTISILFFVIALISNIIFNYIGFKNETYIITNGILFLSYILIIYSVTKLRQ